MAVCVYRHGDDIYLSGAGGTGCLCWRRQDEGWVCAPADLPPGAEPVAMAEVPAELREELLAFTVRAEAIGAGGAGPASAN